MYHAKRFFENEFNGISTYPIYTVDGHVEYKELEDPLIAFSDERIISTPDSKIKLYIIPTNEEVMIARDTYNLINE